MPDGGKLTIETSNVRLDSDYVEDRDEELDPGRYVLLAVTDTGKGMSPDTMDRAFDPFFTTKSVDAGTGLGLSMVQGLVRQIGGSVRLYSEPDVGTTVKLYLPATSQAEARPVGDGKSNRPGSEHILLTEDDDGVRTMLRRQLLRMGYSVTEAPNGDVALAVLKADATIQLLVTDIVMPGALQGPDLARQARLDRPDLPVIFMSGYPREAAVHGNGLRADDINLMKPVRAAELAKALRKVLD